MVLHSVSCSITNSCSDYAKEGPNPRATLLFESFGSVLTGKHANARSPDGSAFSTIPFLNLCRSTLSTNTLPRCRLADQGTLFDHQAAVDTGNLRIEKKVKHVANWKRILCGMFASPRLHNEQSIAEDFNRLVICGNNRSALLGVQFCGCIEGYLTTSIVFSGIVIPMERAKNRGGTSECSLQFLQEALMYSDSYRNPLASTISMSSWR